MSSNAMFYNTGADVDSKRIIYTPSDFARTSLFYLQETGELRAKRRHVSSRSDLSSYLFLIVESGSGVINYKGEEHTLTSGDCAFIDCRKRYSHSTSDELWSLRWVHFNGPNLGSVYEKYISRGGKAVFRTSKPELYRELLSELFSIADAENFVRDMRINERLSALLVALMEESVYTEGEDIGGKAMRVQEVKDYLDEHYTEKITLDFLAERFYINKYYLLEIFGRRYGMGINKYLISMRINKSKGLLRFSDMTVEQIAYECGMNSPHYFSRVFKDVEGVSPSEYRKSWVK